MTIHRALSTLVGVCSALFVSGCFVLTANVPAGTGPINDDDLVGDWRGIDSDTGKEDDVFIHFQKPEPDKPLRVVFVESNDYQIYELTTTIVGTRKIFAAKLTGGGKDSSDSLKDMPPGFFLGFYEVKGDNAVFHLLDADKVGKQIKQGLLAGTPGKSKYDFVMLNGSAADVARYMSSPKAWAARAEPAKLRRLSQASK